MFDASQCKTTQLDFRSSVSWRSGLGTGSPSSPDVNLRAGGDEWPLNEDGGGMPEHGGTMASSI